MNSWLIFWGGVFVGFCFGFLLSSFLISWYAKQRDLHIERLQALVDELTLDLKKELKNG